MTQTTRSAGDPAGPRHRPPERDLSALKARIGDWARELGFERIGVSGVDLERDELRLLEWLAAGRHGEMGYMQRHGTLRSRPGALVAGTIRVISARMNYWPAGSAPATDVLSQERTAYVSRYALGRDYHRMMRRRLQKLADRIGETVGAFGYRAFVDTAPVLEKALARNAGLGWIGKHTNLLTREEGSWFFLGELYTDLPLPLDDPGQAHCGRCRACIDACPTGAIVAPFQLDARRCISYLTIEHPGSIPVELRRPMGNRIYGCDDCQLVCPWNRFAKVTEAPDFRPRHELDRARLTSLFAWEEPEFDRKTEGMAIRRIGHERWLRNIAVALGNSGPHDEARHALRQRSGHPSPLVREHVAWALEEQGPVSPRARGPRPSTASAKGVS